MKTSNILSVQVVDNQVKVTYMSLRERTFDSNVDTIPQTVINYIIDNADTVISKVYSDGTVVNVYADTNTKENALQSTKYYYKVLFGGVEITNIDIIEYYVEYTAKHDYVLTTNGNNFFFGDSKHKYRVSNDSAFYRMIMHYSLNAHRI